MQTSYKVNIKDLKNLVLVDLSWVMNRFKYAMSDVGYLDNQDTFVLTGHIYGTIKTLYEMLLFGHSLLLVVDSESKTRKTICSSYKEHRKEKTKNEYNVFKDLNLILTYMSYFKNVYFTSVDGLEADDVINSITKDSSEMLVFSMDNDLLQVNNAFQVAHGFRNGTFEIIDKRQYILNKYGLDLDFLPVWWKVVRGDRSDNIAIGCLRYPTKQLIKLCNELKGTDDWLEFQKYVVDSKDEKLLLSLDKLELNYKLVKPMYLSCDTIELYKREDYEFVMEELKCKGLMSCISFLEQADNLV